MKKIIIILSLIFISNSSADTLNIFVASDFENTFKNLQPVFEKKYHIKLRADYSATNTLYGQILYGAPVDIFLSADKYHVDLLKKQGKVIANSCVNYAVGSLVMYKPGGNISKKGLNILLSPEIKKIAIANPKIAPYGKATQEVLCRKKLWKKLKTKFVIGENIGQAATFVLSKDADIGFLAYSQLVYIENKVNDADFYVIPQSMYKPILQYAAIMKDSKHLKEAYLFLNFIKSAQAKRIIQADGYHL